MGLKVPLGHAFNLDGPSVYSMAIVFIAQALNIPLSRARGHDAQQFRASGLNLDIAAMVYWNSTYIVDAIAHLGDRGQPVPQAPLAHTSLLA